MRGLFSDILIVLAQTGASTDNNSLFTLQRSPTKVSVTLKGFLFHTNQSKYLRLFLPYNLIKSDSSLQKEPF